MIRTDLINYYLRRTDNRYYLEIGVHKGFSLNGVDSSNKDSVDPNINTPAKFHMTSDEFFENVAPKLPYKYDVIFVDGLHESAQVIKDIKNALEYTTPTGVIILHDCNPISEMRQRVPPDFDIWEYGWNGDVWKALVWARQTYSYNIFVLNHDEGLGVIEKGKHGIPLPKFHNELTYELLDANRKYLLNLKNTI